MMSQNQPKRFLCLTKISIFTKIKIFIQMCNFLWNSGISSARNYPKRTLYIFSRLVELWSLSLRNDYRSEISHHEKKIVPEKWMEKNIFIKNFNFLLFRNVAFFGRFGRHFVQIYFIRQGAIYQ